MASAAIWLIELGTPPPEICQDWSYQLHERGRSRSKHELPQRLVPLTWEDIEVSETGLLTVHEEADARSPDALIEQLHGWSSNSTDASAYDVPLNLPAEVRGSAASANAGATAVASFVESGTAFETTPRALTPSKQSKQDAIKGHSVALLKPYQMALSVAVGLVAITVLGWLVLSATRSKSSSPTSLAVEKSSEQVTAPEKGSSLADRESVSAEDLSIANGTPLPTIDDVLGAQAVSNVPLIEPQRIDLSGVIQSPFPRSSASDALETPVASQGVDSTMAEAVANTNTGAAPAASVPTAPTIGGDVMRDMAEVTASAEAGANETELPAAKSENAKSRTLLEPVVLRTSPMIQTHKLPGTLARPRDPVWSITLAVDDEFNVQPKGPQRIRDKQTAMWLLSNANAKSPVTKLVIQVQAAPGRQTGLRWRIAAGAEDLPMLALPVTKETLQVLQQRVLNYVESTRTESERLSFMSQSAEADMRAMISKQRKAVEAQNKLASRVATVASEAQLLDDLLRNQVTLYVELFDGEKSPSPLLQFGDPQQLIATPDEAAEGATKSDAQADADEAKSKE